MKIHVIEPHYNKDPVTERNALGKSIAKLAQEKNETIFFHDFTFPSAGAPVIILECSTRFMDKVKLLPEFGGIPDISYVMATERSAKVQELFMPTAKAQPASKPSGPKPGF